MTSTFEAYADYVRRHCFKAETPAAETMGAEIEFIPLDAATFAVHPLLGTGGTIALLRNHATALGWVEREHQQNIPRFHTAAGATITFEPGGQIEYSSPPFRSASALLRDLELHTHLLEQMLGSYNVVLQHTGIDPFNGIASVPLQATGARYHNMARYFAQIGPAGARMMRQTCALQVSVSAGPDALQRWRLLNRLAPVLTALFANSRWYERRDSGYASYRAQTWRETDPARTGVFAGVDPVQEYTQFALRAPDLLRPDANGSFLPFAERAHEELDATHFAEHLSTLFPEVRPRGHLEIRCIDAQPPAAAAAPIAFITGIVFDEESARSAYELLPAPSEELLCEAARHGSAAPSLLRILPDLIELAYAGCQRLDTFIAPADVEHARTFLQARMAETI